MIGSRCSSSKANTAKPSDLVPRTSSATSSDGVASVTKQSVPTDVIVKTTTGAELVVPGRAIAGLSDEFKDELLERAKLGRELPVIYENPGSHSQLDKVPEQVLRALPPPRKPLYPVDEHKRTWQLILAFSIGFLFVGLAGYLHVKATIKGSTRLALERTSPAMAQMLVKLGVLLDLAELDADLDRQLLFSRVFRKYSEAGGFLPPSRAVKLLAALLGEEEEGEKKVEGAAHKVEEEIRAVAKQAGIDLSTPLSPPSFLALATACSSTLSNVLVHLTAESIWGITPVPRETLAALEEAYDRIVAARGAGPVFTPLALAELAHEIGFSSDEEAALLYLVEQTGAVARGQVQLPPQLLPALQQEAKSKGSQTEASTVKSSALTTLAVPVSKSEWVEYMVGAGQAGGVPHARVKEYLEVFYMLHLSGIREAAGVKPVA